MIWTLLCIATDVNVREITHIPGEDNERCDRLSRRNLDSVLSISEAAAEMGMPGVTILDMNGDELVIRVIELCDPRIELKSKQQFIDYWAEARRAKENFIAVHAPRTTTGMGESILSSTFPLPFSLSSAPSQQVHLEKKRARGELQLRSMRKREWIL